MGFMQRLVTDCVQKVRIQAKEYSPNVTVKSRGCQLWVFRSVSYGVLTVNVSECQRKLSWRDTGPWYNQGDKQNQMYKNAQARSQNV